MQRKDSNGAARHLTQEEFYRLSEQASGPDKRIKELRFVTLTHDISRRQSSPKYSPLLHQELVKNKVPMIHIKSYTFPIHYINSSHFISSLSLSIINKITNDEFL